MLKIKYKLDFILFVLLFLSTIISFYMTVERLFVPSKTRMAYDGWIFGMCFALTITIYDHRFGKA
jgi:hypothetical protein